MTVRHGQPGHADPRVTRGIYSQVIGESQRDAVEKIAAAVDPSGPQGKAIGKWIQLEWGERGDLNFQINY